MNENENDSSKNALKRNSNLVMKNFRSGQQLHGPDTTACCGHSAEFGHRLPSKLFLACSRWWLCYIICRWSAKPNKHLYDRSTRSVDHL